MKIVLGFLHLMLTVLLDLMNPLNAQWIQTNGPYGGYINSFTVNGTNIFVGTLSSGVFRSTNNGAGWIAVNSGLPMNASVNALAVNGTNVFAGSWGYGVFRSTNNGTS
jgi:hypothetical protein